MNANSTASAADARVPSQKSFFKFQRQQKKMTDVVAPRRSRCQNPSYMPPARSIVTRLTMTPLFIINQDTFIAQPLQFT